MIREALQITEKALGELVKVAAQTPVDTRAHRFVTEAVQVANIAMASPNDFPPESIIEILSLLLQHSDDLETWGLFEDAVGYFKVHLVKKRTPAQHAVPLLFCL